MSDRELDNVSGVGKIIRIRVKSTGLPFDVGRIVDEVGKSDGEQKYVVQLVQLADGVSCEGDATRQVIRIGYYTRRNDGWLCFGSQFAPIFTPAELQHLFAAVSEKGWLMAAESSPD